MQLHVLTVDHFINDQPGGLRVSMVRYKIPVYEDINAYMCTLRLTLFCDIGSLSSSTTIFKIERCILNSRESIIRGHMLLENYSYLETSNIGILWEKPVSYHTQVKHDHGLYLFSSNTCPRIIDSREFKIHPSIYILRMVYIS